MEFAKAADEATKGFHNVKDLASFNELIKKNQDLEAKLARALEDRKSKISALKRAEEQYQYALSEEGKKLAELRVKVTELNKHNRNNAKETLGLTGAYKKLSDQLGEWRTKAKNAGAEMLILEQQGKKNSEAWKNANATFLNSSKKVKVLDSSIKQLDANLGLHQRNVGNYASALSGVGKQLITGFGIVGGIQLLTGVLKSAFNMVKSFDSAMAELAGVLETPKSQLTEMRDLFLDLGGSTAFTATEVAKASTELARLGFTQEKISASIKDILNGTIAFQTELPAVAELAAGTLNAFGMQADQTGDVMNILAASANKTAAGFNDFVVALPKVSAPAATLGITLERTSALLGILRDNSIAAESAGTALRNIFLMSSKNGLSYEQSLQKIANSQNKLAIATEMFGVQNATQAVVLANNIDKFQEYTDAVTNQGNALQFLVDQQMETIAGSLKLLESAWEGFILSIESGDGALAAIFKSIIDGVTSLIVGITDISKGIKEILDTISVLFKGLGINIDDLNSKEFLPSVFSSVGNAISQIKWFIDILKELTSGLVENLKVNDDLQQSVSVLNWSFEKIKEALKPLTDLFIDASSKGTMMQIVVKLLSYQIRVAAKVLSEFISFISDAIIIFSKFIRSNNDLKTSIQNLSIALTSPTTAFKALYEAGKATLSGLLALVLETGPKIKRALLDAINPFAEADFSSILKDFETFGNNISKASSKVFDAKKNQMMKDIGSQAFTNSVKTSILSAANLFSTENTNNKSPNIPSGAGDKDKKKGKDNVKKQVNERIKIMQEELDYYIQSNNLKNKSDEESLQILKTIQSKKEAILEAQRKLNLISETKYQTELLKLYDVSSKEQIDYLKNTVQQRVDLLTAEYDSEKISVEELINAELNASNERRKIIKQEYESKIISHDEYNTALLNESKSLNDKIKNLEGKDADRMFKVADLTLKTFQATNRSKFEEAKILNDELYKLEIERIKKEQELQKSALQAKYAINEQELKNKQTLGEKLKEKEVNYLKEIGDLNQQTAENIKTTFENSITYILKRLEDERKGEADKIPIIEQVLFGEGGSKATQELLPQIEELTKEISLLSYDNEDERALLDEKIDQKFTLLKLLEQERQKAIEVGAINRALTMESLNDGKALIKQAIQLAVAEAVKNALKKSAITGFGAVAIAAGVGLAVNTALNQLLNSISFATGTPNAPFSGIARVDEKGAEIHTDKHGNIKSMGEGNGPRFTHIEKGDKIYTASQSKHMKDLLERNVKYNYLNFDAQPLIVQHNNTFDYDKMERKFLSALDKQESRKKKKSYIVQDGNIITVVEKGNLTSFYNKNNGE